MTTDKGLMVWLPLTDANHCENQGLVGKLTCTTTPTFVDGGKLGKCLSTGAYQMSAEQTAKVFNNNHLTIAFWVYIDAATGASTPCSVFIGDGYNRKFMIMQYPTVNDLHCSWKNDSTTSNTFITSVFEDVLPSYKWTHVAITYENPTAITYINGVEVGRNTGVSNSSTFAYTTPIIGNNTGRRINDFRIYSYALSPQEIKELSKGKIGHWLCDGNGTFLYSASNQAFLSDISGFGRHGQIVGNVTLDSSTPRYDKSIKFSTNTCERYIAAPAMNFLTNTLTFSCWVSQFNRTGVSSERDHPLQFIMSQGRDNTAGFSLICKNGVPGVAFGNGTTFKFIYNTTSMPLNTWHHIAATYDGTNVKFYYDGNYVVQSAISDIGYLLEMNHTTGILGYPNPALVLGKMTYEYTNTYSYFPFAGNISDARVYATALSADDVKELYSLGH